MATATKNNASGIEPGSVASSAWKAMLQANAELLDGLDEELRSAHGYSLGDYDVLIHLEAAPGGRRRMCDLASAVLLSPSGISRRVERLERAGIVTRERAEGDGRNVEAALTGDGKRLLRRLRTTHHAGVRERFVDRFSESELETLDELLGRLVTPDADEDATAC
jgi:DNA-binding MarR family transcriptional regulator